MKHRSDSRSRLLAIGCAILPLFGAAQSSFAADSPPAASPAEWKRQWENQNPAWRGVHLTVSQDTAARELSTALPRFASNGVNVIILEVGYGYEFESHPELRQGGSITRATAQGLAKASREAGIRLIPGLNCLGHQSWAKNTGRLLTCYPEFDEAPGQFPSNTNLYCRSWCPQHPGVNKVVFALLDDLASGFAADALHLGMDEVFLIASEHCPRCKGGDPAKLFAKTVNDLHQHVVGRRGLEMLIWGDRLLNATNTGYGEWEAAKNHTEDAVNLIPKDIILCDWHYGKRENYPSVALLLDKGFRVWPSGWQPLEATVRFSGFARAQRTNNPRILGYLCTTWGKVIPTDAPDWPPLVEPLKPWRDL